MRVLLTGVCGQLGWDARGELLARGHECVGCDVQPESAAAPAPYVRLDITRREAVRETVQRIEPDAVVHCAAWTAVDLAEEPGMEEKVRAVNAEGTRNLAATCREQGCKMLYLSTDYVFDGRGTTPWKADCRDFGPRNVYGRTKLEGERAVAETLEKFFVVRTSWVFGLKGKNFPQTMLRAARTRDEVRVVNDQIGTPTYTVDLARLLADMCESDRYGFYHATNGEVDDESAGCKTGYISWYDFCREIYRQAGLKTRVVPVTTEEYGLNQAARPLNSRLDKSGLTENGFQPLPTWQDAVVRYLKEAGL